MKLSSRLASLALVPLAVTLSVALAPSCDGEKTASVVQAATQAAAETTQQLADQAAKLAETAPEKAREVYQQLVDVAARELEAAKDSEAAKVIAEQAQLGLAKLAEMRTSIAPKLNLATLQAKVTELIERFKNDPRVVSAMKSLQETLNKLAR